MEYITISIAFLLGIFVGREINKNHLIKAGEVAHNVVEAITPRRKIVVLKKKEPLDYAVESALAIEKGKPLISFFKK